MADKTVLRLIEHTIITDEEDDPNQKVALAIIERIHVGTASRQDDEMELTCKFLVKMFEQKLGLWGDPSLVLDLILEKVVRLFPQEEIDRKPQEPSLFDVNPEFLQAAPRHRPDNWRELIPKEGWKLPDVP
jgi:hypothetical protein